MQTRKAKPPKTNRQEAAPPARFRPALFASYRDLSKLRHDFPLVLGWSRDQAVVQPLSAVVDDLLRRVAPRGPEGERLRACVLRLEEEIRLLASRGGRERLSDAWDNAEDKLLSGANEDEREDLRADLHQAREALLPDGDLVACDERAADDVVTHLWRGVESRKAHAFLRRIDRLIHRLENMLKVDAMSSPEAWNPDQLKQTMGGAFAEAFNFEALGGAIRSVACKNSLPPARRKRIENALAALKTQTLFDRDDLSFRDYLFDECDTAVQAHQRRLEEIAALVRAIGVAELELANRYRENIHDQALAQISPASIRPDQVAQFPSPLVRLRGPADPLIIAKLLDALGAGAPIKIAFISDVLPAAADLTTDLARMLVGLNRTFVLQASASQLGRVSDSMTLGLAGGNAAFFNFYSGGTAAGTLPPYLAGASATESRTFPTFAYDPSKEEWAAQFDLAHNPQPDRAWPVHRFSWEDTEHQRHAEDIAFTPVDFAGINPDLDGSFEAVPAGSWREEMIPVADFLKLSLRDRAGRRPYILSIDEENRLWRRVPDERLLRFATLCAEKWRTLQELAGIDNSHTRRLLEEERLRWKEEKEAEVRTLRAELASAGSQTVPVAAGPTSAAPVATNGAEPATIAAPEAGAPKPDEAYIETPRCTSCEECIKVNSRMFAYNENKQAYIADITAGTFRDLVTAAENCQVSIIHPGKPGDNNEDGLDALLKRAEPFL